MPDALYFDVVLHRLVLSILFFVTVCMHFSDTRAGATAGAKAEKLCVLAGEQGQAAGLRLWDAYQRSRTCGRQGLLLFLD